MTNIRVGFGYDVHQLVQQRKLVLGGVEVPSNLGASGHSDADVLIHAICDAILGAISKGDIGTHFPDTDDRFKDISSTILLERVHQVLSESGYSLVNIDSTIVLETPRIGPYIEKMKKSISRFTGIEPGAISIKATTSEKMGFVGKGEGIEAYAVVLVERSS